MGQWTGQRQTANYHRNGKNSVEKQSPGRLCDNQDFYH